jgi:hypothetical protein
MWLIACLSQKLLAEFPSPCILHLSIRKYTCFHEDWFFEILFKRQRPCTNGNMNEPIMLLSSTNKEETDWEEWGVLERNINKLMVFERFFW